MDFEWETAVKGVQLILGVQLVLLAVAKLIFGTQKQYPLAFICLITSMWFLRQVFWGLWQEYNLLIVLIGGSKELFVAPLFLAHLRVMRVKLNKTFLLRHFSIPTVYYLFYLILRIGFAESYQQNNYLQHMSFFGLSLIIFVVYLALCVKEFRHYLNTSLISKAKKKHLLFIILSFVWYLPGPIMSALYRWQLEGSSELAKQIYSAGAYFYVYFFDFYFYGMSLFLLVYGLTETRHFKNLFLAKDITQKSQAPEQWEALAERVEKYLKIEKLFLTPGFTAEMAAKTLGCSKRELTEYLKSKENAGFAEFVNRLKVEEFKKLITLEENQVYDMVSVAEKAGFKSKATFNRVFKQLEGITPREYKKTLEDEPAAPNESHKHLHSLLNRPC